jgi:preprotein translocase subunit SecG
MSLIVVIIHVAVSLALIMIVLLQTGKGADMGAAFGGGSSQTLFGATGASTFLSKMTTAAAVVFMLTSLTLAYMASNRMPDKILSKEPPAVSQPAEEAAPPANEENKDAAAPAPQAADQDKQPAAETQEAAPAETDGDTQKNDQ